MRKSTHFTASVLLLILVAVSPLHAEIKMPAFFSDGMVLQRDTAAPLWGTADPGEGISAELTKAPQSRAVSARSNGNPPQAQTATADIHGNWTLSLNNLPPGGPYTLTIKGKSSNVTINSVLVGDVWFCWGDSNMAQTMTELGNLAKDDIAASADPLLHCFTTRMTFPPPDPAHDQPSADVEGAWAASDPTTTPKFTAIQHPHRNHQLLLRRRRHRNLDAASIQHRRRISRNWRPNSPIRRTRRSRPKIPPAAQHLGNQIW
jgi:sialate O-acetylesterase